MAYTLKVKSAQRAEQLLEFDRLLTIMDELREQCPWDQKQTIQSLRHLTIEETYELADAITQNNLSEIKNEIGDVLLHLVFYAKIASETNEFNIGDVIAHLCEKLIRRHPHIYGDAKVSNEEEVKQNWEQIKLAEKGNKTDASVLEGVPAALPALVKATRIQEKVKGVGFEWENKEQVWEKVEEEIAEFKHEITENNLEKATLEFGDVLFSLVNYARFCKINPEDALALTNEKFITRFKKMEKLITENQETISELPLSKLDEYWNVAKSTEY